MKNGILFLLLILSLTNCKKKETEKPVNSISGRVTVYGEFLDRTSGGMNLENDQSGVVVTLENTSFSAITDNSGNYQINNVPAGTYTISFSKPGFITTTRYRTSFNAGSPLVLNQAIYATPTSAVTDLTAVINISGRSISATGTIDPFSTPSNDLRRCVTVFYGFDNTVSPQNHFHFSTTTATSVPDDFQLTGQYFYSSVIDTSYPGIPQGTTIYIVAYSSLPLNLVRTNDENGQEIFTGLNPTPSKVISIVYQ